MFASKSGQLNLEAANRWKLEPSPGVVRGELTDPGGQFAAPFTTRALADDLEGAAFRIAPEEADLVARAELRSVRA